MYGSPPAKRSRTINAKSTNPSPSLPLVAKVSTYLQYEPGMRIRIRFRSDPVIFGPPDPDPVLFSTDPDPD